MRNWEIKARARSCALCELAFEPGQSYHTVLTLAGEECERKDHCVRCWKETFPLAEKAGEGTAYWQGRFRRLTPEPAQPAIQKDVIERLLKRYLDSEEESHLNLCYILALLEERKKVFIPREKIRDSEGRPVTVYEHAETGETYLIRDPHLSLVEVEAVQAQVKELIEAEKLAEQPVAEESGPDMPASGGLEGGGG